MAQQNATNKPDNLFIIGYRTFKDTPILIKITFAISNVATFFFILGFSTKFWVLGDDSSLGLWWYCDNSAEYECCQMANSLSYGTSSKANGEFYSHCRHSFIHSNLKRIKLNYSKISSWKKNYYRYISELFMFYMDNWVYPLMKHKGLVMLAITVIKL